MSDCDVCIYSDYEPVEFFFGSERKCRKPTKCQECGRPIERGTIYHRVGGKYEGEMWSMKVCTDCKEGRHANMALPMLRQYDIGCTSGHDSLIRLWMPDNFTREDVEHIQAMWGLLIRQFERRVASTPAPDAQQK